MQPRKQSCDNRIEKWTSEKQDYQGINAPKRRACQGIETDMKDCKNTFYTESSGS